MALAILSNSDKFTFTPHCVSGYPTFPSPSTFPPITSCLANQTSPTYSLLFRKSMSSPASAVNVHNQAGRDNVVTQTQTIINDRSVWFLILVFIFSILHISNKGKVTKRLEDLQKILRPRMIENASYNDQKKHPCKTGTRENVLQEIVSWIEDVSKESQCFYWLSGEPGVGKSAITTSVVKHCVDHNILGAQFFINRDDTTTTNPAVLFPTICWQLCKNSQRTAIVVDEILRAQPTLVDDISFDQASKLFVKAIEASAEVNHSRPVVIVIDALDETDTKRVGNLAQILSKVVTSLPRNAKVFISSRTEEPITKSFNPLRDLPQVKSRHLAAKDSVDEVLRFMEEKIKQILLENSMDWEEFKDDIRRISSQASGLYIWAETALKLLRNEIEDKGTACFGGLLDMLAGKGMNDINTLYMNILQRTCKDGDWEHQRFRRIVGAIIVRRTPLSIADMTQLLDLRELRNSKPVDVVHFVRRYRTVLVKDTIEINGFVVPRMHKSFADFVKSECAQKFRINESESHGEMALRCIDKLCNLYPEGPESEGSIFPSQLVYASQHWQSHLTRMVELETDDAEEKEEYDTPDIPKTDSQSSLANPRSVKDLKPDTESEKIKGKKQLGARFVFSRDGTQLAVKDGDDIKIWDTKTSTVTMSLVGHQGHVNSVGFSPDGTRLVSASSDKTARIWDVQTGAVLHVLRGHISWVEYATFSHDGRMVVTCSSDLTVRTWNTSTGQQLNVFKGHRHSIWYCTFSPDDQRIASLAYSRRDEIIVWGVNSGTLISEFTHEDCQVISFCPCNNHVMSCDRDGSMKLWDAESGKQLDHNTDFTDAPLAFLEKSEQESTNTYIHVPPALERSGSSNFHVYSLKTKYGYVWGIVERDQHQGVWELIANLDDRTSVKMLSFSTGATVANTMSFLS